MAKRNDYTQLLSDGMVFENIIELYNAMGWSYENNDSTTNMMMNVLALNCKYHVEGQKIIIDKVYDEPLLTLNEMAGCLSSPILFAIANDFDINHYDWDKPNKLMTISMGLEPFYRAIGLDIDTTDMTQKVREKVAKEQYNVLRSVLFTLKNRCYINSFMLGGTNIEITIAVSELMKSITGIGIGITNLDVITKNDNFKQYRARKMDSVEGMFKRRIKTLYQ